MSRFRSELLRELDARGFIHQCTDAEALDAQAADGRVVGYVGFDCTADSLHVGNLVSIMMLRWLQRTGGRPIALMGGGTTKVGDPSGKDESRQLLTDEQIEANKAGHPALARQVPRLRGGARRIWSTTPSGWTGCATSRSCATSARHFTVNRMLTFDSVRLRLEREQPLTLLEFNYMVMQAYDFLELSRRHACRLQMGGSDQWGNIVNGVELGRRIDGVQLFGLTTPLITTASGEKMGKTRGQRGLAQRGPAAAPSTTGSSGATPRTRTSAASSGSYTELPLDEIARLERLAGCRDQRGQEGAGLRGDAALPRDRGRGSRGRRRPGGVRGRGRRGEPAGRRAATRRACRPGCR